MSDQDAARGTTFDVSIGPDGLKLLVHAGGRTISIDMSPEQAATLGLSLISGGSIIAPGNRLPSGENIVRSIPPLPLTKYQTGKIDSTGDPVLIAHVRGGPTIPLCFDRASARSCGAALAQLGNDEP